jgi:hypothetical protein
MKDEFFAFLNGKKTTKFGLVLNPGRIFFQTPILLNDSFHDIHVTYRCTAFLVFVLIILLYDPQSTVY